MLSLILRKVRRSPRVMFEAFGRGSGFHPSTYLDYLARRRTARIAEGTELHEPEMEDISNEFGG